MRPQHGRQNLLKFAVRNNSLDFNFSYLFQNTRFSNVRIGSGQGHKCSGAPGQEGTVAIIANPTGARSGHGAVDGLTVLRRNKDNQFQKTLPARLA
ncbi:MAG: hypothetical protein BWY80_01007 [Firmicutes bacterium ADurb.Bin456]|nr:MAG: hypothetical protein BWY80_01007 [Firmicutes bacterium ADurb.Bin456]